jgi:hypothetical protein
MDSVYGIQGIPEKYNHDRFSPLAREMSRFFHAVGTMRSARNADFSNPNEFFFELFAQYMIGRHIKFKPLPDSYKSGKAWRFIKANEHDRDYYNTKLEDLATTLEEYFEDGLRNLHGAIFVM